MKIQDKYYEHFKIFWIPILNKQVIVARRNKDNCTLLCINKNILSNVNLSKEQKKEILDELGIERITI